MSSSAGNKVVVFDLDDTLYKEIDFLRSAYQEIADRVESDFGAVDVYAKLTGWHGCGDNAFERVISEYGLPLTVEDLLAAYRSHRPAIALDGITSKTMRLLYERRYILGIITDGRTVTQMNKVEALGLTRYIPMENVIISERFGASKPSEAPYLFFMDKYPGCEYTYVGDNTEKDFIAPDRLGWRSFCIMDDGRNIHRQDIKVTERFPSVQMTEFSSLIKKL